MLVVFNEDSQKGSGSFLYLLSGTEITLTMLVGQLVWGQFSYVANPVLFVTLTTPNNIHKITHHPSV